MKKLLTLCLFTAAFSFTVSAQTSRPTGSAATQPSGSSASTLTPKQKMLCQTWQIKTVEAWAVVHDATDAEKKDLFWMGEDGNCRFIWGGNTTTGKWTIDKSCTWMKITSADGTVTSIKVTSVSDSQLVIDYKDKDDQHNIVTYDLLPGGGK